MLLHLLSSGGRVDLVRCVLYCWKCINLQAKFTLTAEKKHPVQFLGLFFFFTFDLYSHWRDLFANTLYLHLCVICLVKTITPHHWLLVYFVLQKVFHNSICQFWQLFFIEYYLNFALCPKRILYNNSGLFRAIVIRRSYCWRWNKPKSTDTLFTMNAKWKFNNDFSIWHVSYILQICQIWIAQKSLDLHI